MQFQEKKEKFLLLLYIYYDNIMFCLILLLFVYLVHLSYYLKVLKYKKGDKMCVFKQIKS